VNGQPLTDLTRAVQQVSSWKQAGKRIVFTNGCFDLLHPGHVAYLQQAKSLGDILVIGLNDDDSIRRLKGSTRPVNPLESRAVMLAALKSVDMVIAFSEDTPLELIRKLQPDILVKGGDYTPETIVGAEDVCAHGGEVIVIPFLDGHSSTGLISRIRESH